jgi:hypothetical protein
VSLTAGALTTAIDTAFQEEWKRRKNIPLPDAGKEDRQLLFAAVARGVLTYLKDKEGEWISSISTESFDQEVGSMVIDGTVLNIDTK